jgi:hypothetical protein
MTAFEIAKQRILGKNYKSSIRDYSVTMIVGEQGMGKTSIMAGFADSFGEKNRVLVIDVAGALGFQKYRLMSLEAFLADAKLPKDHPNKWKKGVRKLRLTQENADDLLVKISENFFDGFLIIDELKQSHKNSGDIPSWGAKIFLQCRNNRLDVIVAIHKFYDIHVGYCGHIKAIVMFKTPEKIESSKYFKERGFQEDCEELFQLYQEVIIEGIETNSIEQVSRIWYTKNFKLQCLAQLNNSNNLNGHR